MKDLYWNGPFEGDQTRDLLILHYRRKFSKSENFAISYDDMYVKRKEAKENQGIKGVSQII